jgi:DNA-binding NtrC family response regulator
MRKILLVDDEEYIRRLYAEELSEEGYEVVTVATGHDLLRKINLSQPSVVILDIKLLDYNGLELLQEIRSRHHDLPVILCTAYDTYKEDPKAFAADYYVVKSFDLSELKMMIGRALETASSIRLTGTY